MGEDRGQKVRFPGAHRAAEHEALGRILPGVARGKRLRDLLGVQNLRRLSAVVVEVGVSYHGRHLGPGERLDPLAQAAAVAGGDQLVGARPDLLAEGVLLGLVGVALAAAIFAALRALAKGGAGAVSPSVDQVSLPLARAARNRCGAQLFHAASLPETGKRKPLAKNCRTCRSPRQLARLRGPDRIQGERLLHRAAKREALLERQRPNGADRQRVAAVDSVLEADQPVRQLGTG